MSIWHAVNNLIEYFCFFSIVGDAESLRQIRERKKKSRWGGSENDKTFIPGMPTVLPSSLDSHQQEAYLGDYIIHAFCSFNANSI